MRLVLSPDVRACVGAWCSLLTLVRSGPGACASTVSSWSSALCLCDRRATVLFEAVNFGLLFVCHVQFSTILASIVFYDAIDEFLGLTLNRDSKFTVETVKLLSH